MDYMDKTTDPPLSCCATLFVDSPVLNFCLESRIFILIAKSPTENFNSQEKIQKNAPRKNKNLNIDIHSYSPTSQTTQHSLNHNRLINIQNVFHLNSFMTVTGVFVWCYETFLLSSKKYKKLFFCAKNKKENRENFFWLGKI